jgi:hypothetical protein
VHPRGRGVASVQTEPIRADAVLRPRGRIFTSADGKNRLRVKSRPRGKHRCARTSGQ